MKAPRLLPEGYDWTLRLLTAESVGCPYCGSVVPYLHRFEWCEKMRAKAQWRERWDQARRRQHSGEP
jgi:hypothetical protein